MARALRPTYKQKKIIDKHNLDPKNWLVKKDTDIELELLNKVSRKIRTIKKSA